MNEPQLRKALKLIADFLIERLGLDFSHVRAYHHHSIDVAPIDAAGTSLSAADVAAFTRHLSTQCPLLVLDPPLDAAFLMAYAETLIEDSLCSPLAESYKQYVPPPPA